MSSRYAQVVIGPAGSGKSTYIKNMIDHFGTIKRKVHSFNFDPSCDNLLYEPSLDIRDAIDSVSIMKERNLGPNGALIYCLESVLDNVEWFDEQLGEYEDDFLLIDMPGQIEIYSHLDILPKLFRMLQSRGYKLCAVFLLDSQFMIDSSKFLSGCLVALSVMTMLEIPHFNLLSKCDLLSKEQKQRLDEYCDVNTMALWGSITNQNKRLTKLTSKICNLIDEFGLLQFVPFDPSDTNCIENIVAQMDLILQYYDNNDIVDEEYKLMDY